VGFSRPLLARGERKTALCIAPGGTQRVETWKLSISGRRGGKKNCASTMLSHRGGNIAEW